VYTDRSLACADCGQEFTFTAGEQEFYAQRGFSEAPKRCASCRQIRKAQRSRSPSFADSGSPRGDGYGDGYPSGGYSAGGYSTAGNSVSGYSSGYAERRPREMFEAVCANCGRTASVPFRPSGSKPVYCSDCFESRR
jgi:CxxC-x17-CxxC domain-containing protein